MSNKFRDKVKLKKILCVGVRMGGRTMENDKIYVHTEIYDQRWWWWIIVVIIKSSI